MKKIAYIELDTHAEIASNFLELMKDSEKIEVDFYFSKKIEKIIDSPQNIILSQPKNLLSQLKGKKYDLVIIGTAHRYFNILKQIENHYHTAIITHNIHFSKSKKWDIFKNIFKEDFKFRLKLFFKESLLLFNEIYKNANIKFVLDKNLEDTEYSYLPIFYSEIRNTVPLKERLKIVIPGAVSQKRRDYQHILQKIKTFRTEMDIIFCGKASGIELEWLQQATENAPKNINIQYFTKKLNHKEFSDILASADILWCPIQHKTSFMSVPEYYGKTKMSGNIGDAIKYQKPAIFPKNYASEWNFIFAEKENIEQQFYEILNKKCDFEEFDKKQVLKNIEETLLKLI